MADQTADILPPPSARTWHLCIDMQRLFSLDGPWPTPWMDRVLPQVTRIAAHCPERTIFTRFIPPEHPEQMQGTWRPYYERWRHVTREVLDPGLIDLVAPLRAFVPPARVLDKPVYSAFGTSLQRFLAEQGADGVIITGGETDVCVLASVLDAVDLGLRVYVAVDALCSSSDPGHDAVLTLYNARYGQQIGAMSTEAILELWPGK